MRSATKSEVKRIAPLLCLGLFACGPSEEEQQAERERRTAEAEAVIKQVQAYNEPPDPAVDTPRMSVCREAIQKVAGTVEFRPNGSNGAGESPHNGGVVEFNATYRTPGDSPVHETFKCWFKGGDTVRSMFFGPMMGGPPEHMRAPLDAAGIEYGRG